MKNNYEQLLTNKYLKDMNLIQNFGNFAGLEIILFVELEFPHTNINKWRGVEIFCREIKIYLPHLF